MEVSGKKLKIKMTQPSLLEIYSKEMQSSMQEVHCVPMFIVPPPTTAKILSKVPINR